jgi:hypothetical protein
VQLVGPFGSSISITHRPLIAPVRESDIRSLINGFDKGADVQAGIRSVPGMTEFVRYSAVPGLRTAIRGSSGQAELVLLFTTDEVWSITIESRDDRRLQTEIEEILNSLKLE